MKDKILALLSSIRFWMVTLAAVSIYLGNVESNGFDLKILLDSIATWLGVVVGIGTADKLAQAVRGTE